MPDLESRRPTPVPVLSTMVRRFSSRSVSSYSRLGVGLQSATSPPRGRALERRVTRGSRATASSGCHTAPFHRPPSSCSVDSQFGPGPAATVSAWSSECPLFRSVHSRIRSAGVRSGGWDVFVVTGIASPSLSRGSARRAPFSMPWALWFSLVPRVGYAGSYRTSTAQHRRLRRVALMTHSSK